MLLLCAKLGCFELQKGWFWRNGKAGYRHLIAGLSVWGRTVFGNNHLTWKHKAANGKESFSAICNNCMFLSLQKFILDRFTDAAHTQCPYFHNWQLVESHNKQILPKIFLGCFSTNTIPLVWICCKYECMWKYSIFLILNYFFLRISCYV